ncbi:MAG: hypothetical protein Q9162_005225 [Coniocarpon cinnabarinum]
MSDQQQAAGQEEYENMKTHWYQWYGAKSANNNDHAKHHKKEFTKWCKAWHEKRGYVAEQTDPNMYHGEFNRSQ